MWNEITVCSMQREVITIKRLYLFQAKGDNHNKRLYMLILIKIVRGCCFIISLVRLLHGYVFPAAAYSGCFIATDSLKLSLILILFVLKYCYVWFSYKLDYNIVHSLLRYSLISCYHIDLDVTKPFSAVHTKSFYYQYTVWKSGNDFNWNPGKPNKSHFLSI